MTELILKEGQSIMCFKKGDHITRLEPAHISEKRYNENLGIEIEVTLRSDQSMIGEPYEFIGIFNNQIWLKMKGGVHYRILGETNIRLNLKDWGDGWGEFVLPEGFDIKDI